MVVLNIFHVLIAIAMVALVLVQRGAGATAGAAFGSGASGTVFGARGAGTFLTKSTWVLAALFCSISLTMAVMVSRSGIAPVESLGVITASEPVQQETREVLATEAATEGKGVPQADLPTMMINENKADTAPEQAAQDLPGRNDPAEESTEINQGQEAAGTDSDDS